MFASGNKPEGKDVDGAKRRGGRGSRMLLRCERWDPGDPWRDASPIVHSERHWLLRIRGVWIFLWGRGEEGKFQFEQVMEGENGKD